MRASHILVIIFTAVMAFSALYAPQPIQPMLMREYGVSVERSALLTTITMLPLALAPVVYGFILESFSSRSLLRASVLILGLLQFLFILAPSFNLLIAVRLMVGIVLPAVLTSLMTYISTASSKHEVQRNIALYVSSTIMGGFAGRFFSGLFSTLINWQIMFIILGLSLIFAYFLTGILPDVKLSISRFDFSAVKKVLSERIFTVTYIMIFSMFFMFAALLNFLPYRIQAIAGDTSALTIGIMYSGYVMGLTVSLNSVRIMRFFKGEVRTIFTALTAYCLTLLFFIAPSVPVMFFGMFLFCGTMFLAHSVASGYLNRLADSNRGMTNGLYVAFYYSGGTLGSILPGFIYRSFGWSAFLLSLGVLMSATIGLAALLLSTRQARQT